MAFAISDGERRYFVVSSDDEERLILDQVPNSGSTVPYRAFADAELLVAGVPKDHSVANVYSLFRCAPDLVEVRLNKGNPNAAERFAFLKFLSDTSAEETAVKFAQLQVDGSKLVITQSNRHKTVIVKEINENLFDEVIRQDLRSRTGLAVDVQILRSPLEQRKSCYVQCRDQVTAYLAYKRLFQSGTPAVCGYRVSVEPVALPYQGLLSRAQFLHYEVTRAPEGGALCCRLRGGGGGGGARLVASPVHPAMTVVDALVLFGAVPGLVELRLQHQFALLQYRSAEQTQLAFHTFHHAQVRGQQLAVLPEVISPLQHGSKRVTHTSLQTQEICITDGTGQARWFLAHQWNGQHIGRLAGASTDGHPELYVASIDTRVSLLHLLQVFGGVAQLTEVRLMISFSGFNRGFAFVRYATVARAAEAASLFHRALVFGKRLTIQKSTNSKSLVVRRIPLAMVNDEVEKVLRNVTAGVSSVVFFGPVGRSSKKCCLVNYVDHPSATSARRKLIPHCLDIFGCRLDIDWAPVNGNRRKRDDCGHFEDEVMKKLQELHT